MRMVRPIDSVWVKSKKDPGLEPLTVRGATRLEKLVALNALNISARNIKSRRSPNLKCLAIPASRLEYPGARKAFRPNVRALGRPVPSMKCTVVGSTQFPIGPSGLVKPVAHDALMMARVLSGAARLLMSGRSAVGG